MNKLWQKALRRLVKNRRNKARKVMMGVIEDFCLWSLDKQKVIKDLIRFRQLIRNRLNGYLPGHRT